MPQPSPAIIARLADEIEQAGQQNLLPPNDARRIADALRGRQSGIAVQLIAPTRVTAHLQSPLIDVRFARCANSSCGGVVDLLMQPNLTISQRCPHCGGHLVPAPVWAITAKNIPDINRRVLTTSSNIRIALSLEEYGNRRPSRVFIRDRARPIASLEIDYTGQVEQPLPSVQRNVFTYWLSMMPSESLTKPLSITAFAYNRDDCTPLSTTMGPLSGVAEVLFCRNLEVLQATIAYKAGHYRTTAQSRAVVLDMDTSFAGALSTRIYSRYIRTQGLVVRVSAQEVREALESLNLSNEGFWTAIHTMSHAFLVSLPQITGLEGSDFGEALSVSQAEFAIYDNAPGGLGGLEGVIDLTGGTLDPNYEMRIRESADCQLVCTRACKACLYTDSCFMLNWSLDRRVLLSLGW
ncbi:MAG: hypothetical protein DRJ33_03355 [Candidatus Methanomethylicota archaeon]|uniref:MrfA-like Zn-binding domain-containing protein n=1 Tax=Thermoproteota archaeon TaxID=2056631 RepID=A0A497EYZ0_9CREN|nr:MAG: hypothetical protein DRJ33_03355 [Candidatus Verstraetearchaeota archaeon]